MINLNFGLWWSGSKLSYLRYLTFKSLRYFHPHSRIQLYTSGTFEKRATSPVKSSREEQEYNDASSDYEDYMGELKDLDVEIVTTSKFSNYTPNHQSDFFRWWFLQEHGGFYLDTDQIILKSFRSLPLNYKMIYSTYRVNSPYALGDIFSPVGVLGSYPDSKVAKKIYKSLGDHYDKDDYNCIGPLMFADFVERHEILDGFNAPSSYFYPAPICDYTDKIYNGEFKLDKKSYALHWFGGYGKSQEFNKSYTEEKAKVSNDTISQFLRRKKMI